MQSLSWRTLRWVLVATSVLGWQSSASAGVTHDATLLVPGTPSAASLGTTIVPFGSSVYAGAPGPAVGYADGVVHEFDFAGTHLGTVVTPVPGAGHGFGYSAVVRGASIFVGDPFRTFTGEVYERDINTGAHIRTFVNPNVPQWVDRFGHALAMVGDRLVVGSPTAQVGTTSTGLIHVYHRLTGAYQRTCQNPAGASVDAFGWSLATIPVPPEFGLPAWVLVGAPDAAGGSGLAYVIDTGDCSVEITLTNPLLGTTGAFGTSVAVSDGRFIVGAPDDDRAYVFDSSGTVDLTLVGPDPGSQYGIAVAGVGSNVLVGAPLDDLTSPGDTGVAFLHDGSDGSVAEVIVNPLGDPGASFGASLGVSGSTFFIGAPTHDPSGTGTKLNSGAVTVHTWTCGNGVLDAGETCDDGNTLNDDCCSSVCLQNPDGTACSDGNQCTVGDVCQSGACEAGTCLAGTSCVGLCGSNWICDNQAGCQCVDPSTVTTSTTTSTSTSTSTTTTLVPDPSQVAPDVDKGIPTVVGDIVEFIYEGPDPIQFGVPPGTIERKRAGVIKGRVLRGAGVPLDGVRVSIFDHEEYGWTFSRLDGEYDLVVNGGGTVTVKYELDGWFPVTREIDVPWNAFVRVDDVVMMQPDEVVTTVALSPSTGMQVAEGSLETDADGTRQATLLVPAGTEGTLHFGDGSMVPLPTMNVRLTEYTVGPDGPAAMPAALPPSSGYTYALELSADEALAAGATMVEFSQPLPFYVENFLGFPVGTAVPLGHYDRERAVWVPADDGLVIGIVGITGGLAELDLDGDGVADDETQLGVSQDELAELGAKYTEGTSLWRVLIPHFTPWDCNWPYGPPEDAEFPNQPKPDSDENEDDQCERAGCVIEVQSQTLRESVPVVGTGLTLNYSSRRVPGRLGRRVLDIPLSGGLLPASVKRIELAVEVAGQREETSFAAIPDQTYAFAWDGKDAYGRALRGSQSVAVDVGYVYDAVYQQPQQLQATFGLGTCQRL